MVVVLQIVLSNVLDAGTVNWKSILYFVSSFVFALGTMGGTFFLLKNFSIIHSRSLKYYLLLVALSLLSLTIYFGWHGFIGLRFWHY